MPEFHLFELALHRTDLLGDEEVDDAFDVERPSPGDASLLGNLTGIFVPLTGLFVPLTGLFVPLTGLFVPLTGLFVPLTGLFVPLTGLFVPTADLLGDEEVDNAFDVERPSPGDMTLNRDVSATQIPARLARPPRQRRRRLPQAPFFVGFSQTLYKQGFQQPKLAIVSGMPEFHLFQFALQLTFWVTRKSTTPSMLSDPPQETPAFSAGTTSGLLSTRRTCQETSSLLINPLFLIFVY